MPFQLDEVVWAKITGYPWWPAQIISNDGNALERKLKVRFFGDNSQYVRTFPATNCAAIALDTNKCS